MLRRDSTATQPKYIYINRRHFLVKVVPTAGALLLAACAPSLGQTPVPTPSGSTGGSANGASPTTAPTMSPSDLPAALAHTDPFATTDKDELGSPLNKF